jgi:N utilization substance protein A
VFEGEPDQQTVEVEVRDEDRGIAIGKDGKNIFKAKKLAQRQHNIAHVQILQKDVDGAVSGWQADEQSEI